MHPHMLNYKKTLIIGLSADGLDQRWGEMTEEGINSCFLKNYFCHLCIDCSVRPSLFPSFFLSFSLSNDTLRCCCIYFPLRVSCFPFRCRHVVGLSILSMFFSTHMFTCCCSRYWWLWLVLIRSRGLCGNVFLSRRTTRIHASNHVTFMFIRPTLRRVSVDVHLCVRVGVFSPAKLQIEYALLFSL